MEEGLVWWDRGSRWLRARLGCSSGGRIEDIGGKEAEGVVGIGVFSGGAEDASGECTGGVVAGVARVGGGTTAARKCFIGAG